MLGTLAFLIVATMITIIVVVAKVTSKDPFNGSAGPRGGVPMAPPGPPLPVILGTVNHTRKMSGAYFGVSIDWVRVVHDLLLARVVFTDILMSRT